MTTMEEAITAFEIMSLRTDSSDNMPGQQKSRTLSSENHSGGHVHGEKCGCIRSRDVTTRDSENHSGGHVHGEKCGCIEYETYAGADRMESAAGLRSRPNVRTMPAKAAPPRKSMPKTTKMTAPKKMFRREEMKPTGSFEKAMTVRTGSARIGSSFVDIKENQTKTDEPLHNRVRKLRDAMIKSPHWFEFGLNALEKTVQQFETTTLNIDPMDEAMLDFLPSIYVGIGARRAMEENVKGQKNGLVDQDLDMLGTGKPINLKRQFEVLRRDDPANTYAVDYRRGKLPGMISVVISSEKKVLDLNASQLGDSFVVRERGTDRILGVRTFVIPEEAGRPAISDFSVSMDAYSKKQTTWLSFIQFKGRVGQSAQDANDELGLPLDKDGNFMLDTSTPVFVSGESKERAAMKIFAFISWSKIIVLFTFVQMRSDRTMRLSEITTVDGNFLHQAFGRVIWIMNKRLNDHPLIKVQQQVIKDNLIEMRNAAFASSSGFLDTMKNLFTRAKRSIGVAGTQRAIDSITEARSLHHYTTLINYLKEAADVYPAAKDYSIIVDTIASSTSRTKAIPLQWKAVNSITLLQITGSKFDNIFKELWTRKGTGEPIVRILAPEGAGAGGGADLSRYRILVIDADAHPLIYGDDFYRTITTEQGNSAKTFDQQSRRSIFLHLEQNTEQESQVRQLKGAPKSIAMQLDTADEDTREVLETIPPAGAYLGDYVITNAGRDPSGASNPFVVLVQFIPDTRRFGRMGRVYFIYQKE